MKIKRNRAEYFRGFNNGVCLHCEHLTELAKINEETLIKRNSTKCKECSKYSYLVWWWEKIE